MEICNKKTGFKSWTEGEIFECEACGNHVCKECALAWRGVCPNCFGRLLRIS